VKTAIDNTIDAKNKARFDPYFSRLEGLLETNEYTFALEVLSHVAHNDRIDDAVIYDKSVKHNLTNQKEIIEIGQTVLHQETNLTLEQVDIMSEFDVYYETRELIKQWNQLPKDQLKNKELGLEVQGFKIK
jgi:hypothetical protein